jgi:serine/threonine protein kinase
VAPQALGPTANANGSATDFEEQPRECIGHFRLLQKIGEGGFGVVFLAEQERPVNRRVAIKIIKPGMDTRQVIARFEAERQVLAMMDHPNIAKVFDAGSSESGRPYFVMELVQGVPITEYCDECHLTTRERLELFITICQAVQHAHQKGIIHRDIKPNNVLVGRRGDQDGQPAPKIIDFGVAKAIDQQLTEHTLTTAFAQMVGTPLYMSPEQAELSPLGVDTRSDIYSLGVVLYELLTGATPFGKDRLHGVPYDELRRIIREEEPPRPSARISTLAADKASTIAEHRRTDTRRLGQQVRGELDWIVMKCLEKDRNRRYESASSLARDIERYLNDEPVHACPPSTWYRTRKFARRNKTLLAAGGAIAAALVVGLGLSTWMYFRERAAVQVAKANEARATSEAAKSLSVAQFMTDMLKSVAPGVALGRDTQMLREILDSTAERLDKLKDQPEVEAELRTVLGNVYSDLGEYTSAAEMHRKAMALRKKLYGDQHPGVTQSLEYLSGVNYWDPRGSDVEELHREAAERRRKLRNDQNALTEVESIYRELLEIDPDGATEHNYHLRLAETVLGKNPVNDAQGQEARRLIRRAMEGYAQVAIQYPNDVYRRLEAAIGYVAVAKICADFRDYFADETEEAHRRLFAELQALLATFPDSNQCQWQCAMVYRSWAFAIILDPNSASLSQAEQAYRNAIDLLKKKSLAAADPPRVSHYLASTHAYLGDVLVRLGRPNEAESAFRAAIDLYDERPMEIEREPIEELELGIDCIRFAYLLATRGQPEEASGVLDKAASSIKRLGNTDYTAKHTWCLALARLRLGDNGGYRQACAALEKEVNTSSDDAARIMLPWACALGPNAIDDLTKPLKQAEANIANHPINAPFFDLAVLGGVLYRAGKYDRAARHLEESIATYPSDRPIGMGTVHFPQLFLAMTRWQQGQRDQARRLLDETKSAVDDELQSPLSLWQRRATLEILRREAENLIKPMEIVEAVGYESPADSRPLTDD